MRLASVAVAYILLVVAAVVAEAVLVAVFAGLLSRESSAALRVVEQLSEGLVYGAYGIAPVQVEFREPFPGAPANYTYSVPGIHVVLVNPNPFPRGVVVLAYHSASPTYKIIDLGVCVQLQVEWGQAARVHRGHWD